MKKISVIMPSYLGEYDGCSSNREEKFLRAVKSFNNQTYQNKELIIVSDGCSYTRYLCYSQDLISENGNIKLFKIKKKPLFSGLVRDYGLHKATGDIICYLDSDDYFGNNHLATIADQMKNNDWVYWNDYLYVNKTNVVPKIVEVRKDSIGTSSIAHINKKRNFLGLGGIRWKGCNAYGHDWTFIQRLMKNYPNFNKIYGTQYNICHIPNVFEH